MSKSSAVPVATVLLRSSAPSGAGLPLTHYPSDQCLQQEGREPRLRRGASLHVLQLCSGSPKAAHESRNGGWRNGSALGDFDIAALVEAAEEAPKKRGPYKKKDA
jgi:hypothetical protein